MNVIEFINLGCAILSTSAELAPHIKKYISKKSSKKMTARKIFRQATVETDDEDEETRMPSKACRKSSREEGLGLGELKDLVQTLQTQSETVQAHSKIISHLVNDRNSGEFDKLSSIPEGSKIQTAFDMDDEARRPSLRSSLQDFSFPVDAAPQSIPGSPASRASSISMSYTTTPSSPATSMSSMCSFPSDRRLSFGYPPPTSASFPMHANPSSQSPASSVTGISPSSSPNTSRRVSFRSTSSRPSSFQAADVTIHQSAESFVEKALSAALPNKYQSSGRSPSRTMSLQTPNMRQTRSHDVSTETTSPSDPSQRSRRSLSKAASLPIAEESQYHPSKRTYKNPLSISTQTDYPRQPNENSSQSDSPRSWSPHPLLRTASTTKRHRKERLEEYVLSVPLPNKYQGTRGHLSRTMSLPVAEVSQRSLSRPKYERAFSSQRSDQLSSQPPREYSSAGPSPPPSPASSSSSTTIGRDSSFSSQSRNRHAFLQPLEPHEPSRRPSNIPSKEQWRSSLKYPTTRSSTSPRSYSPSLSNTSDYSTPRSPISTPKSPSLTLHPSPRSTTVSDSFYSIIPRKHLIQLHQHTTNIPLDEILHYASTWSYSQTLDQFLYPDHPHHKNDDVLKRSYLSSPVRSHISELAHSICSSSSNPQSDRYFDNKREGEADGKVFSLFLFLLRFLMFFGTEILRDAPGQCFDGTGLREVSGRYRIAEEIAGWLEEREGVGFM